MVSSKGLLYKKVKQNILEEIKGLERDSRLPSRTDLLKKYNVTRTTIERAISELIGEGVLYARDGSGTYVYGGGKEAAGRGWEGGETGKVANWGVILPNITHDTYPGILRGIEDIANKNNINVIICNTDNYTDKQELYIKKLIKSKVDGIIIVPAIIGDIDTKSFLSLRKAGIPFVFCNRGIGEIDAPRILSNNFYGAYIATKHLLSSGYRSVAFVSRPYYSVAAERLQGYLAALSESGIEAEDRLAVFEKSFEEEKPGYEITLDLFNKGFEIDSILCFNDMIAKGAYDAVVSMGRKVGRDVGIIGYDNTAICERLPVKLTSVSFKTYEIGNEAAEMLLKISKNGEHDSNKAVILQPELIIRESSRKNNHKALSR